MAKNRSGRQQQPMRRGQGRQPGAALSAALAGRASPGLASAVAQGQGQSAGKLASAIGLGDAGMQAKPKPAAPRGRSLADAITDPGGLGLTGARGAAKPAARTYIYINGGNDRTNDTSNARHGMGFREFTVAGKAGVYHEYTDPKTGQRHVFHVKGAAGQTP